MRKILILPLWLVLLACQKSQPPPPPHVVTISRDNVRLVYDCDKFDPQAKTNEQAIAITLESVDVSRKAIAQGDFALARSLRSARELKDTRRVEELTVQFECSEQAK